LRDSQDSDGSEPPFHDAFGEDFLNQEHSRYFGQGQYENQQYAAREDQLEYIIGVSQRSLAVSSRDDLVNNSPLMLWSLWHCLSRDQIFRELSNANNRTIRYARYMSYHSRTSAQELLASK
jgi:hypothetical protein